MNNSNVKTSANYTFEVFGMIFVLSIIASFFWPTFFDLLYKQRIYLLVFFAGTLVVKLLRTKYDNAKQKAGNN
ncbi:hypothetical protein [Companilactobacillus mishanensis]|uniref:Uncharacterized protein n=1 Tax=Companilactobacillus mishanensis TaxID=2486008 RepID=A0A5P0ZJ91_9LACO|nr:hypothetical protein [Companilactobacillus mishanensis]MQS53186.1 hypothetical protein [Companilactobacillus mishanensis]